jgi:hypothetical protein
MGTTNNDTWIIEAGDADIAKRTALGDSVLSPLERLIYCVWVADYGLRNAGDLETACELYPDFQREAAHLAGELGLGFTHDSFSSPAVAIQGEASISSGLIASATRSRMASPRSSAAHRADKEIAEIVSGRGWVSSKHQ